MGESRLIVMKRKTCLLYRSLVDFFIFFLTKHGYGNNDAASQSFIILLLNRISLVDADYRSRFITKKKKKKKDSVDLDSPK